VLLSCLSSSLLFSSLLDSVSQACVVAPSAISESATHNTTTPQHRSFKKKKREREESFSHVILICFLVFFQALRFL
jgi:hypothetical protein